MKKTCFTIANIMVALSFAMVTFAQDINARKSQAERLSSLDGRLDAVSTELSAELDELLYEANRIKACYNAGKMYDPEGTNPDAGGCVVISERDPHVADFAHKSKTGLPDCGSNEVLRSIGTYEFECVDVYKYIPPPQCEPKTLTLKANKDGQTYSCPIEAPYGNMSSALGSTSPVACDTGKYNVSGVLRCLDEDSDGEADWVLSDQKVTQVKFDNCTSISVNLDSKCVANTGNMVHQQSKKITCSSPRHDVEGKATCFDGNITVTEISSTAKPADGACGVTKNTCSSGTYANGREDTAGYHWSCLGESGGATTPCYVEAEDVCEGGPLELSYLDFSCTTSDKMDTDCIAYSEERNSYANLYVRNVCDPNPVRAVWLATCADSARLKCVKGNVIDLETTGKVSRWSCQSSKPIDGRKYSVACEGRYYFGSWRIDWFECDEGMAIPSIRCNFGEATCDPAMKPELPEPKECAECSSKNIRWGAGDACGATLPALKNGETALVKNNRSGYEGVARYTCDSLYLDHGQWMPLSRSCEKVNDVAVNGSCGESVNSCVSGLLWDTSDSSTKYLWQCNGSNGGSTVQCAVQKEEVVAPKCGDRVFACDVGSAVGVEDYFTDDYVYWTCKVGELYSPRCSARRDAGLDKGSCGESVNTCESGTFEEMDPNPYRHVWRCRGKDSATTCSVPKSRSCTWAEPELDYNNRVEYNRETNSCEQAASGSEKTGSSCEGGFSNFSIVSEPYYNSYCTVDWYQQECECTYE